MGSFTNFPYGLTSFGGVLTPSFPITGDSRIIWCDNVVGNDGNDGTGPGFAVKTVARAYSLIRAGFYDTVILVGRGTAYTLTAALAWTKDYTNLVGFTAPIEVFHRARITSGTATISPMITFSGTGISVQNLQLVQFGSDATLSAIAVTVSGQRCYFDKVHFAGGGNATVRAGTAMRSLVIDGGGGNGENKFVDCAIGLDTVDSAGVNYELEFLNNTPRNLFQRCQINKRVVAGGQGGGFINFPAGSIDRWTIFRDLICTNFTIGGGAALTTAFNIVATGGQIIMDNPITTGATGLSGGAKTNFLTNNAVAAATVGLGLQASS